MQEKVDISYQNIFKISLPVMLSGLMMAVLGITDTAFIGRVGELEIAAVGNGTMLYFVLGTVGMGFSIGSQIIIGRKNGEKAFLQIGNVFTQSIYFVGLLSVVLFTVLFFLFPLLLSFTVKSENILQLMNEFLQYRSFGIFFSLFIFLFNSFHVGITKTNILLWQTAIIVSINVVLEYFLIFGYAGFPQMGLKGAALASDIAECVGLLFMISYTYFKVDHKTYGLFSFKKINLITIKNILTISGPVMLQNLIALGGWFVFFSIIEHIGERELTISHIIRNIYILMMIPVFSMAQTTNTMVSNLIGQNEHDKVLSLVKRTVMLALMFNALSLLIVLIFKFQLIGIFTPNEELIMDTYGTLYVILGAMFVFSIGTVQFNAVSGTGNTMFTLTIEIITMIIYLFTAFGVVKYMNAGVEIAWSTEFLYFGLLSVMCYMYLKSGKWKLKVLNV
mgnify:CR=1 FL=1